MNHIHYFKSVKHLETIDVYRVLDLFAVTDSALAHAAKKILCAGNRGAKDQAKDVQEAIDSLQRWQEMQRENIVGMTAQEAINYADESQYTEADKQAASLDPALVELCSKTTIHADADGWIEHVGDDCPLTDRSVILEVMGKYSGVEVFRTLASNITWSAVTHWRYAK